MTDNIIGFPHRSTGPARKRLEAMSDANDLNALAALLGTPAEWLETAIEHLRMEAERDTVMQCAMVSKAALQLVLAHLDRGRAA